LIPSAKFDIVNLIIQRQEAAVYEKAGRTSALSEYGLVLCGHAAVYRRGRRGRAVYPCGRRAVRHAHHVYHQPRKAFPAQAAADELRADGDGFRRHFRPRGLRVPDGGHPAAGK